MKHDFILLLVLICNIIASIYVFSNGFLIRRVSLNNVNNKSNPSLKKFNKSIILFIDALRFDFIFKNEQNENFGIRTLESLIDQQPFQTRIFKFIADPPTTTMQRIKALMTGTLPTFIDAGSNFDSYLIEEDNIIKQMHRNNKSVMILGDDTWLSLFDSSLIHRHHTYPSFNIKDLDTNDQNVDLKLKEIFTENQKWDLIVAHYLGIDHCGHSFGPNSPVLKRKLNDIDQSIKFIVDSMDDDTLLIIMGDHGMTETGDHGGDSQLELETALIFYSKKNLSKEPPFYRLRDGAKMFRETRQINLTPTLALLLGIPIPFSNLGIVIEGLFENGIDSIMENADQMTKFIKEYEIYDKLIDDTEFNTSQDHMRILKNIQDACREKWSTFNLSFCVIGLICIFLSIVSLYSFFLDLNDLSHAKNQKEKRTLIFFIFLFLIYISIGSLIFKLLENIWVLLGVFNLYLFINSSIKVFKTALNFVNPQALFVCLSFLIPFSNSYIIKENNSLRFLLTSFLFYEIYQSLKSKKFNFVYPGIILLLRLSHVFYVCREETLGTCVQTIFSTQMLKSSLGFKYYFLFYLFNFFCTLVVFNFIKTKNFHLNTFLVTSLTLIFCYNLTQLFGRESDLLKPVELNLARAILVVFLVQQALGWNNKLYKSSFDRISIVTLSLTSLISLVSAESSLSIWVLTLIYELFFKNSKNLMFIYLLEYYFFYASGHETTFTHIKWESGFHGFDGDNNNRLIRVVMGLLIILNTFPSKILSSFHLVKQSFKFDKKLNYQPQRIFLACIIQLILISSVKVLFSALSVFLLRRHLMVWKIFAPRFAFEMICFLIGVLSSVITLLFILFNQ